MERSGVLCTGVTTLLVLLGVTTLVGVSLIGFLTFSSTGLTFPRTGVVLSGETVLTGVTVLSGATVLSGVIAPFGETVPDLTVPGIFPLVATPPPEVVPLGPRW